MNNIPQIWYDSVFALTGNDLIRTLWWKSPNKSFNGLTPVEQWETDPRIVQRYILDSIHTDYL